MAWHPLRNVGLKIVALGLGALLWFTVSGQQAERTVPGVPVVYRNKPPGLEITDQTNSVDIHVRGLDNQLRVAMQRDFEARVDLTDARAGEQTFVVRTDQIEAPFGVEVTRVDPGTVMAVLEPSGSANLPVQPLVEGTPAPGFIVSRTEVDPSSVTVIGPQRRVATATATTTDRVSIEGARSTVTATVSVGVPDSSLRLRESRTARVVVIIEPAGERLFAALRISVRNLGPGLRATVEPTVVSMLIRGPESLLARLEPAALRPHVDVTALGQGRHEVPVDLDLGGTLTVASVRPSATVTVTIH
jgi:YbbR domain-containing protein